MTDHNAVRTLIRGGRVLTMGDGVFVAGRPLKRNGQLLDVDLPALVGRLTDSRRRLMEDFARIDHGMVRGVADQLFSNLV